MCSIHSEFAYVEKNTDHPSYCTSAVLHIRPTEHPTYATAAYFCIIYIWELEIRLIEFLQAERWGYSRARGSSAADRTATRGPGAARPKSIKQLYNHACTVGRMGSRTDGHRFRNIHHQNIQYLRNRAENFRMVDIRINAWSTLFLNLQIKYGLFSSWIYCFLLLI